MTTEPPSKKIVYLQPYLWAYSFCKEHEMLDTYCRAFNDLYPSNIFGKVTDEEIISSMEEEFKQYSEYKNVVFEPFETTTVLPPCLRDKIVNTVLDTEQTGG